MSQDVVNNVVSGVFVIDKPVGMTSHDVVQAVRRGTGIRRAGHTGTLDPRASENRRIVTRLRTVQPANKIPIAVNKARIESMLARVIAANPVSTTLRIAEFQRHGATVQSHDRIAKASSAPSSGIATRPRRLCL